MGRRMAPNPRADTSKSIRPNFRYCIVYSPSIRAGIFFN
jgi:hypothetical protein